MQPRQALAPQNSTGKQVVELNGYVIILVESRDGKTKLYGSPADKDNLEVGDEILDVNERKLEDLPRAEVIRYIHECIQSCVIKLRVKRRSDARLAGELCTAVQDAFVIAVEQQARERLQRLSALKRITPVDMSQLSIKLNQQQSQNKGATTQDYSFLKEASPIYVTSLTSNHVGTAAGQTVAITTTTSNNINLVANSSTQITQLVTGSNQQSQQQQQQPQQSQQQQPNNNQHQTLTTATPPITVVANDKTQQHQQHHHHLQKVGVDVLVAAASSSTSSSNEFKNNNINNINNNNNNNNNNGSSSINNNNNNRQNNNNSNNNNNITSNISLSSSNNSKSLSNNLTSSAPPQPQQQISFAKFYGNCNNTTTTTITSTTTTATTITTNNTNISTTSGGLVTVTGATASTGHENELIANGHGPRRGLSTLSEGDSEPTDDLSQQQQQQKKLSISTQQPGLSSGGTEVLLGDQSLRQDNRPRRRSGSSIVVLGADEKVITKSRLPGVDVYMGHCEYQSGLCDTNNIIPNNNQHTTKIDIEQQQHEENMLTMLSVNQHDNGPYQEMAVDVPESFIARNKTPPRYPPPRNQNQKYVSSSSSNTLTPSTTKLTTTSSTSTITETTTIKTTSLSTIIPSSSSITPTPTPITNTIYNKHHNHSHILQNNCHLKSTHLLEEDSTIILNNDSYGKKKSSSIKGSSSLGSTCESIGFESMSYRTKSRGGSVSTTQSSSSDSGELGPPEYDLGPHRELPVDVPDSFVEQKKAPPRYPPPQKIIIPTPSSSSSSSNLLPISMKQLMLNEEERNLMSSVSKVSSSNGGGGSGGGPGGGKIGNQCSGGFSSADNDFCGDLVEDHEKTITNNQIPQPQVASNPKIEVNGSVRPVPPPRDHLRIEKDGRLVNRAPAPQVPDRKLNHFQQIAQIVEPTNEQLDSIKKYQEQLRRRQEEQDRIVQQNEFLRASLRGSRKLQALQDGPLQEKRPIGIENDAYDEDEEIEVICGYGELVTALQRLQDDLSKHGMSILANRVTAAKHILAGPNFARALAIRTAVLERRRPRVHNPVCSNAQQVAKDCVESLAQLSSPAAIELCDLLSTYEMEGLLLAQDRIATTTDRTAAVAPGAGVITCSQIQSSAVSGDSATLDTSSLSSSFRNNTKSYHNNHNNLVNNNNVLKQREPIATPSIAASTVLRDNNRGDPIRIIQIEKSSEPLGATILNEGEAVVIGRIVRGGAAEKSGLLHERDEILEVNGIEMSGKNVNDVCALLSAMSGTLTFLIVPAGSPPPGGGIGGVGIGVGGGGGGGIIGREPPVLHVRAHFDYDPEDDRYIPCRELGISFQKGDVLHVISRDDPNWWQTYREGEEDQTLAGLIPSQSFQHQREAMRLAAAGEAGLAGYRGGKGAGKGSTLLCMKKSGKGRKKKGRASSEAGYPLYATTTPDETDPEEILTYEEVSLYYPRASHKRPIVLIGPPNIGRHELRQRLMADSDRFAAAVPHTSRQRREGEVPGQDYHFISRVQFEADILSRKFVEHGEYERAYYGTSLEAIRAVVSSEKICVLNLHPQSLKLLRASDLKPYVVLVAPPSLEKLRQKKVRTSEPVKDDDLKEIIATARDMEARWGHLFDMIIINNDTERAYHQLLAEINSLEREPQWVPASWVHN